MRCILDSYKSNNIIFSFVFKRSNYFGMRIRIDNIPSIIITKSDSTMAMIWMILWSHKYIDESNMEGNMGKCLKSRCCFFIELERFECWFSSRNIYAKFFSNEVCCLGTKRCTSFWIDARFRYREAIDISSFCMEYSRRKFDKISMFKSDNSSGFSSIPSMFDTISTIKDPVCPINIDGSLLSRDDIKRGNLRESNRKSRLMPECARNPWTHSTFIEHLEDIFRAKLLIFSMMKLLWFWDLFLETEFRISYPKKVSFPGRKISFFYKKLNEFWIISPDTFHELILSMTWKREKILLLIFFIFFSESWKEWGISFCKNWRNTPMYQKWEYACFCEKFSPIRIAWEIAILCFHVYWSEWI